MKEKNLRSDVREFRYRSACGNHVRVRWTPDGLLFDTGNGWQVDDSETVYCSEYVGPGGLEDAARFNAADAPPEWWRPGEREGA